MQMEESMKKVIGPGYSRIHGSGTLAFVSSKEDMEYIIKIIHPYLLIKVFPKVIYCETKEQRVKFIDILLSTLGASLLGNMLVIQANQTITAGQDF